MEGVDTILQEYGSLAGKPPQSTPIVRLYKSQKTSYHGMIRSFQDTIRSYQGMIRPYQGTQQFFILRYRLYTCVFYVLTIYLLLLQRMNGGTRIGSQHQQLLLAKNSLLHFFFN